MEHSIPSQGPPQAPGHIAESEDVARPLRGDCLHSSAAKGVPWLHPCGWAPLGGIYLVLAPPPTPLPVPEMHMGRGSPLPCSPVSAAAPTLTKDTG